MSAEEEATFRLDEVVFRNAEPRDHAIIVDLFRQSLLEGLIGSNDTGADIESLQDAYFSDDGDSCFWVAEYREEVIGMIGVQKTSEGTAEIRRLRVREDYRRKGVGARLMEMAVAFCRDHGCLKVILDVRIERGPAISLFENFGFTHGRSRDIEGRRTLDFYLDLYRDPGG